MESPTTYIQASSATFKDLVQKLTGAPDVSVHKLRPKATVSRRRKHSLRDIEIIKLGVESAHENSPDQKRILSNAFSSPVKGPTTPLGRDPVFCERVGTESPPSEEERAIAEKGFYLHASPGKREPPALLTLFPLTSPNHEY